MVIDTESTPSCEAALEDALQFVRPKLQDIKTEKGLIGLWCQAWRTSWAASNRTNPEITDDMVERAAKALYEEDDVWHEAFPWPTSSESGPGADAYRRLARAAITAALKENP